MPLRSQPYLRADLALSDAEPLSEGSDRVTTYLGLKGQPRQQAVDLQTQRLSLNR